MPARSHGMSNSPEYQTWRNIMQRCYYPRDKRFAHYGGRGIRVCSHWLTSFENFFADMGPRPSADYCIERRDPNGDYGPGNCSWDLRANKNKNRRNSIVIEHMGRRMLLRDLAREFGLSAETVYSRWRRGLRGAELFAQTTRRKAA